MTQLAGRIIREQVCFPGVIEMAFSTGTTGIEKEIYGLNSHLSISLG